MKNPFRASGDKFFGFWGRLIAARALAPAVLGALMLAGCASLPTGDRPTGNGDSDVDLDTRQATQLDETGAQQDKESSEITALQDANNLTTNYEGAESLTALALHAGITSSQSAFTMSDLASDLLKPIHFRDEQGPAANQYKAEPKPETKLGRAYGDASLTALKKVLARGNITDISKYLPSQAEGEPLTLEMPVNTDQFPISSRFATEDRSYLHRGTDFAISKWGPPVRTMAAGQVIYAGFSQGYGKTVMIHHGNLGDGRHIVSLYAHAARLLVRKGEYVRAGQNILKAGDTGRGGQHLHAEVLVAQGKKALAIDLEVVSGKRVTPDLVDRALADAEDKADRFGPKSLESAAYSYRAVQRGGFDPGKAFDVRTASRLMTALEKKPELLAAADSKLLHTLSKTPESARLASMMISSPAIAARIENAARDGFTDPKRTQHLLAASGHYNASIDGAFGPLSRQAHKNYISAVRDRLSVQAFNSAGYKTPKGKKPYIPVNG